MNDASAVRTFSQAGSLTLGGNVSIAAGPIGRNAEAAGAASLKGVAGVFAYSKTKGLFAGVSLEGSGFIERKDANEKMYGRRLTARELLSGQVPVPPQAGELMALLSSRYFSGQGGAGSSDMYNDTPVYSDAHEDVVWQGRTGSAMGEGQPSRNNTWQDDVYDRDNYSAPNRANTIGGRANPNETFDSMGSSRTGAAAFAGNSDYVYSDKPKPSRPTAPKPAFGAKPNLAANQAIAKFTFDGEQAGDLSFKKGEIITIVKRTESETDWWTGRIGAREGIFPRYV